MQSTLSFREYTHPMVVMKLVVKEPSEKRKRRQLLPTPAKSHKKGGKGIKLSPNDWYIQGIKET